MKPNFALSLSFDGIRLLHRVPGGWHLVGEAAFDAEDLAGELTMLRRTAQALDPSGMRTKILIPNDQIKYLALDNPNANDAEIRSALDGKTPYALDELAIDSSADGEKTYMAAVARETLDEAVAFAREHRFQPVSFAAVPEAGIFVGEVFFGNVEPSGEYERDDVAVFVIGKSRPSRPPEPEEAVDAETGEEPAESGDMDNMAAKILGEFISNNPYCLKNLDISWNHFSCQATSDLLKTFYGNEELKFLNVSHNRVTMTDQLKEFGLFVR